MIEIQPPIQIVYFGNGCEGYSPSMFLPAKNEMTTHTQIESQKEYFLQFNYVYALTSILVCGGSLGLK